MFAQLLASGERVMEFGNDFLFFLRKFIRIGRINGWETAIFHYIIFSIEGKHLAVEVNVMEQHPVFHFKFRMTPDDFGFQFKLDHTDCLVHLCDQA